MSQAAFEGSRKERLVLGTCAALLVAVFAFHFACTLLYLTPPNPIRLALHEPLEEYMQPYFYQSWRLFAPEPGGTDAIVLVACRLREGEGVRESDLLDITTPLHEHRYQHRFSPGLLLARAERPRLFLSANPMHDAIRRYGLPNPVVEAARAELAAAAKRRFETGQAHANRIASVACARRFREGHIVEVKARYVSRKVPPFGIRDAAPLQEETHAYELPWAPYEVVDGY
jgi:hypothetical protein